MKASISFNELQKITDERIKTGTLSFSKKDSNTIHVVYRMMFPVQFDLRIEKVVGSDLYLSYGGGMGTGAIFDGVFSMIQSKPEFAFIEKQACSGVILHLGQVEKLKSVFNNISVQDITVLDEGLEVNGSLIL